MDPITAALSAASIGLQIFGASKASAAAQQANAAEQQIVGLEQQENAQRHQQMELDASRKSMQDLRNAQRARAIGLSNATSQGAQFGSGLQGGYGQISGESGTNLLGISQNRQIGENVFSLDSQITQQRLVASKAKSDEITANAYSSFGKDIGSAVPAVGKLDGGFSLGNFFGGDPGGSGVGIGK